MTASRAGAFVVALPLLALPARAAEVAVDASVRVATPACPIAPLSIPAFVDTLRVELASGARPAPATLVSLAIDPCDTATTRVHVGVTDASGPRAARDVGLEDIALEARPRALALAVAELVRGTDAPPPAAPLPASPPALPRAPAPSLAPAIAADALVAYYPSRGTLLGGGRLAVAVAGPRARLALFGEAAFGERDYALGQVDVLSLGGGLVAGRRWPKGRFALEPGLVGALAWSRVSGEAGEAGISARAGSALTAAVRARLAAAALFVRVVEVHAFVEAGWVVRALDANVEGAGAAGLSGASLVLGVGLGL